MDPLIGGQKEGDVRRGRMRGKPGEDTTKWKPMSSSQTVVVSPTMYFPLGSAYPSIWTREAGSKPASMADAPSWGARPSSYLVFTVLLPTYFTLMARGEERRGEERRGDGRREGKGAQIGDI